VLNAGTELTALLVIKLFVYYVYALSALISLAWLIHDPKYSSWEEAEADADDSLLWGIRVWIAGKTLKDEGKYQFPLTNALSLRRSCQESSK
jgi:hypothetical protein